MQPSEGTSNVTKHSYWCDAARLVKRELYFGNSLQSPIYLNINDPVANV